VNSRAPTSTSRPKSLSTRYWGFYLGAATERLKKLCEERNLRYVGTRGALQAPVCVVGEAPGEVEERLGFPFTGPSGQEQDRMLSEAGLTDCWFTNCYKCRPPDNDLAKLPGLGIPLEAYEDQLWEELNETRPTLIIAAGATALGLLGGPATCGRAGPQITKWRGSLLTCSRLGHQHFVIPISHPAFVLREWSERDISIFVLRKVREELNYFLANGKLQPLPERQLIIEPTFDDAFAFLNEIAEKKTRVSVDIEMLFRRFPYTVALATSPSVAMSIGFGDYEGEHGAKLWRLLDRIFRNNNQIGQNYLGFDSHWLETLGFRVNTGLVDDTMVAHHVLWPELPHKLEFLAMQYTREPYYKDEGRKWRPSEGKAKLMRYNCKDATVTYEVFLKELEELNFPKP